MKKLLFSLLLLAIGFSAGFFVGVTQKNTMHKNNVKINNVSKENNSSIQVQSDMNEKAYQESERTDKELNIVYKKVLQKYKNDKVFISKLQKAELAWIKFKDAHIQSIYPAEDKTFYGSVYPMCANMTIAEITQERINQLKLWLDGTCEGLCTGSIPQKSYDQCK